MADPTAYPTRTMLRILALLCVLLFPASAFADNLATEWIDRVTHEVQQEEGPLSTRALDFHVYGGVYGYYTNNLFLAPHRHADGDSAAIGYARGRLDYSDARLEVAADLLVNFDYYMEHHAAREDEERFFGKIRWTDSVFDLQLVEIARRESDALDAVFADHARRIVTDTLPRIGVKIPGLPTIDAFAQIQTVHFEGNTFDGRENVNYRAGLAALVDLSQRLAFGADAGILGIHYREREQTPNAFGYFAHGLLRGEVTDRFLVEIALGASYIHGRRAEFGDDRPQRNTSFDAEVHLRYEATQTLTLLADYSRRFGFAGIGNTYEAIDRGVLIAEWQVFEPLRLRARGQYDYVAPSESFDRAYWSGGLGATLQVVKHFSIDGGVIYRGGNTRGISGDRYSNWIVYLGAVVDF